MRRGWVSSYQSFGSSPFFFFVLAPFFGERDLHAMGRVNGVCQRFGMWLITWSSRGARVPATLLDPSPRGSCRRGSCCRGCHCCPYSLWRCCVHVRLTSRCSLTPHRSTGPVCSNGGGLGRNETS